MPHFRSLNRFVVALALALAFVGVRAGEEMFAATSTFATLPNLKFNQGQTVTVAFAASGFPTGITYSATGLPAGLSMTMGVDTLGHNVGIVSGTLPADTPTGGGSEGVYSVRVRASDGGLSNIFSIDVSHWNHGDVFVGAGQWVYQVYREDASFKTDVTIPDNPNATYGSTTGCAVNWRTGEVWATNFDDVHPAVNVITRHSGSNPLPYTDPSRRLSTERYGVGGAVTPSPGNMNPFDENPESVAFNNAGDMFIGHSFGFFNDNGDPATANGTPIILSDPIGGWVYVDAAGQPLVDINNNMIGANNAISPAGIFERWINTPLPVNILDRAGKPMVAPVQGGMDLHRYIPNASGNYSQTSRQFYDLRYGLTGVDTLDLLSDQKTMNYSSEDWYIRRYDVGGSKQLPVVGSTIVGESRPASNRTLYGIRALPPGDGTGGYMAVNESHIERLTSGGRMVQMYDVKGDPDYEGGEVNGWFAIAIAPDARTFWAATRQDVFHFDIASGAVIGPKIRATVGTLHTNAELAGLCVMDEYRAAQEVCGASGLGNGIDDDQDGTIDEGCFRVEICSALSPGDDDGDGLIDYNDPDCGAPASQQCVTGGPTDNSVGGFCERADYEGDTVAVPGIPPPCMFCDDWTFSYTATGLPTGLTMNATTGAVTGMPFYSIVNPNTSTAPPVVFHVTVNATWQQAGGPAASFTKTFDWTIFNRNRVPVAVDDGVQTVVTGTSFSFDVRLNDSDIDGDNPLAINSFTQPPAGQGTVVQSGQNLVYTAPASGFVGLTSFTYTIKDTYIPAGVSNVATVRVKVNGVPVARSDAFSTPEDTPLAGTLTGNDTLSADGGNIWVIATAPAHGAAVVLADGTFTYAPAANFNGTDTFSYRICDADGDCSTAVVTITVTSINDVPEALDDAYTTPEDTQLVGTVVTNDTLSGDGGNVWSVVRPTPNGALNFTNNTGSFTYMPKKDYNGTDSFDYKICDSNNDCSFATAIITINPTNDVPVAVSDVYAMEPNTSLTKDVSGNDSASGDGGNVWTQTSSPSSGTVVWNGGAFTYTPVSGFVGVVSFNYRLCDANNDCSDATVTITVTFGTTGGVGTGDTATIGFWRNTNGQALIKSLNGGPSATNLGNWLAANYPYLYGANSTRNLAGKTNTQIAAYDVTLFSSDKKANQVFAGALAAYVTNTTLAGGNFAGGYKFNLSVTGTGTKTFNVGSNGTAIGLVNNTSYTVYQLLQQANLRKQLGTYNTTAFNVIFDGINQKGDIK